MPKISSSSSARGRGVPGLRALLRGKARRADAAAVRQLPREDIDALAKRVILPSLPVSDEEMARATHQDRGQKLARQELWGELSAKIRYADGARLATPGGETASLLLAFGARSDVVCSAEDALHDGAVPHPGGLDALEEILEDFPDDYATALIVALAHVDTGWAWRNIVGRDDPETAASRCAAHVARAEAILNPFEGYDLDAPSLLAARCALDAACDRRARRLPADYEALLRLDPDGHRHMRALGRHILPAYAGGLKALEVEARKAVVLTEAQWGAGGYAWVYFDALALDKRALDLLDPEFFVEGLRDIVARKQDQHIINLLTAFCAITMAPGGRDEVLTPQADAARAEVHDCLDWLLQDHLQELHPLIWSQMLLAPGHAPFLPSRRALVAKGRQTALRIIAARFANQIADGSSIAFSQQGMYRLPAL
ncbi:hypothetical protein [Roseovarius aestuariivivens]|uniref:hypothetical protein n=1 Tax=Roseovarius aestuariivivens TaxID=1888910 RepID=UPI00108024BF|nr:hypothetical protein [Roseovarius aestuariivivens]